MTNTNNLAVQIMDGAYTVLDLEGGRWWPSAESVLEIEASEDPAGAAILICLDAPMRGRWSA